MTRLRLLMLGCAACWGEGPTPTQPSGVEVVLYVPFNDDCNTGGMGFYIGDVAIADGMMSALFHQWYLPDCGGNPGGQNQFIVGGIRVPLDGGARSEFEAGPSQGSVNTRVTNVPGRGTVWVNSPNTMGSSWLDVGGIPPVTIPQLSYGGMGGWYVPTGFVSDADYGFVMTTTGASNIDFNNPEWPCCGGGPTGSSTASLGWQIDWAAGTTTPLPLMNPGEAVYADSLKTGLVANSTTLFYTATVAGSGLLIKSMPKQVPVAGTTRATVDSSQMLVGFDVNETTLYWATTWQYTLLPAPSPGCRISSVPVTGGSNETLLNTSDYFCNDLALDDTHAYFTIIAVPDPDGDDNGGSQMPRSRGIGLGRIELANPTNVETIRTGIDVDYAGPRRVFADGDDLYAVDGFTVARLDKSKFAGKHDF